MNKIPLSLLESPVVIGATLSGSALVLAKSDATASSIDLSSLGGGGPSGDSQDSLTVQDMLLAQALPTPPTGDSSLFSVIITRSGLKSWGSGTSGQLGQGEFSDQAYPKLMGFSGGPPPANIVKAIVAGNNVLALTSNGVPYGCGENKSGQLGTNNLVDQPILIPIQLPGGITPIVDIQVSGQFKDPSTGALSSKCIFFYRDQSGYVYASGGNNSGQLGLGDTVDRKVVTRIWNTPDAVSVVAAYPTTYLLAADGTVWATGDNVAGQLGINSVTDSHSWVHCLDTGLTPITNVAKLFVTSLYGSNTKFSVFALKTDGSLWACGGNVSGQLGQGDTTTRKVFTNIPIFNSDPIVLMDTGGDTQLVYTASGKIYAWGENSQYTTGLSSVSNADIKTPGYVSTWASGGTPPWEGIVSKVVVSSATAARTAYILCNTGALYSCGYNTNGQAGSQVSGNIYRLFHRMDTIALPAGEKIVDISNLGSGTSSHLLALTNRFRVLGIGANTKGQTGTSTNNNNVFNFGEVRLT